MGEREGVLLLLGVEELDVDKETDALGVDDFVAVAVTVADTVPVVVADVDELGVMLRDALLEILVVCVAVTEPVLEEVMLSEGLEVAVEVLDTVDVAVAVWVPVTVTEDINDMLLVELTEDVGLIEPVMDAVAVMLAVTANVPAAAEDGVVDSLGVCVAEAVPV